jgi:HEAT repeat protein/lysophospholipase L1-like esterase
MGVTDSRREGRRAGAREVALALATFVACAAGLEGLARQREPESRAPASYITDWQDWNGEFYTVKSTAVGWPPWEDYNTEGLRDREHALEKRPSAWRVACLGDSVTLGFGIRPQEAWPQKLEELAAAEGRDLDVMNVALGGWSTRQELIAYRRIARRYRPDEVLVGICLNDVAEMQNNLSRPPRWISSLYGRSALVRFVVGARQREIRGVEELFGSPGAPQVRRGYERMFADLRALHEEVRADGARLGVLVFPFRFQVAAGAPPPLAQGAIAAFCAREGIAFLDLLPALSSAGESAFHDYDHLSPAGAERVAASVLRSPLLRGGTGAIEPPPSPAAEAALREAAPAAVPVPRLEGLLEGQDPLVRANAARALGRVGDAALVAVPALIAHLADADERVRWRAAEALDSIGPRADSVAPLARLVHDASCPGRGLAAEELGRVGAEAVAAVPDLIGAASDPRPDVRWRAVWALGQIGPRASMAVPALRTALEDDALRWRAAEALGEIGPAALTAEPSLLALLHDSSSSVRWRAATALGSIGARDAAPELAAAASDAAENVRLAAVTSLVELRAQAEVAEPALLQALRDPDRRIRQQAVRGIGRFEALSPRARSGLEAASRDADPAVREKAGQVLARVAPAHGD